MFSKRLKFQLVLNRFALVIGAIVTPLAGAFLVPQFLADSPILTVAVLAALVVGCGSHMLLTRAIAIIAAAMKDIERVLIDSSASGEPPAFSATTRRELPGVTRSLDAAMERLHTEYERALSSSRLDGTTGLPNRAALADRFAELVSAQALAGHHLLFIDLDRFKGVNDSLGHAIGDQLLGAFANRISVMLVRRGIDQSKTLFARLGGDEFCVLLGPGECLSAPQLAEAIIDELVEPFPVEAYRLTICASIGISAARDSEANGGGMMRRADLAMYDAKAAGRGTWRLHSDRLDESAKARLEVENLLREAVTDKQFELHMQPIVSTRSNDTVAAEVLLRWNHPTRGLLFPKSFIEVAEDSGLICEIGDWVAEEAFRLARRLELAGQPTRIALNMSIRQLEAPNFIERIELLLAETSADPTLIEVEITESLVMQNSAAIIPRLAHLRALGMTVAVDDFGTGYSNLARLKTLPIDRVKIDQSLVRDIAVSSSARTILQAIVGLAHGLGYDSVVEGIESPIQRDIVSVVGCGAIQGFDIAKPMPEAAFLEWASARRRAA